jgi:O-antigen/teichoic acid export membrane protein
MAATRPPRPLVVRLTANAVVQAGGSGLASLIGLGTFVAVTRALGPEAFGDFATAMAFLFLPIVLADVGIAASVLREISASPERTDRVMSAALPLRGLIAAGAVGLAVAVGMAIPFNGPTKTAILIGSLGSFLHLLTLSLVPAIQAQLKVHWAVAANLAGRLVTLGVTLGALNVGLGFASVVWAHVAGLAVTFALHLLVVTRLVSLRPVVDAAYWRSLVRGALVLGLAVSLAQIYFRIDTLLLALLRPSADVGLYGAAYKFIELSQLVVGAIGISFFPPLARFVASGDPRRHRLIQKSFDVLIVVAAPLAVVMFTLSSEIITLTAGSEFAEAAAALELLAPFVLFSFVNGLLVRVLLASKRDRTLLALALSTLALNVGLNLAFIPAYGFRAAAVISVVCEATMLVPAAMAVRRLGALPSPRYAPMVALAGAAMAAVVLVAPGPALLVAGLGGAVYVSVLVLAPGTVRELSRSLLPRRPHGPAAAS